MKANVQSLQNKRLNQKQFLWLFESVCGLEGYDERKGNLKCNPPHHHHNHHPLTVNFKLQRACTKNKQKKKLPQFTYPIAVKFAKLKLLRACQKNKNKNKNKKKLRRALIQNY